MSANLGRPAQPRHGPQAYRTKASPTWVALALNNPAKPRPVTGPKLGSERETED
jgi:hypothetical protein